MVEIFRTLEALYPGRIDLGLGRAPGTDPLTFSRWRSDTPEVTDLATRVASLERVVAATR